MADRRIEKQLANGTQASYTYDAGDRLTLLVNATTAGVTLSSFAYQYDRTQNRLGVTDASGAATTWSYDPTYQLTGEQRSTPGALDWVDFTLAQWQSFTLAQWQAFKLDASDGVYNTTYTYDPVGNRILKNDSGALTTSTYDVANRAANRRRSDWGDHVHLRLGREPATDARPQRRHYHQRLGR